MRRGPTNAIAPQLKTAERYKGKEPARGAFTAETKGMKAIRSAI
jgi:hypothetical protein